MTTSYSTTTASRTLPDKLSEFPSRERTQLPLFSPVHRVIVSEVWPKGRCFVSRIVLSVLLKGAWEPSELRLRASHWFMSAAELLSWSGIELATRLELHQLAATLQLGVMWGHSKILACIGPRCFTGVCTLSHRGSHTEVRWREEGPWPNIWGTWTYPALLVVDTSWSAQIVEKRKRQRESFVPKSRVGWPNKILTRSHEPSQTSKRKPGRSHVEQEVHQQFGRGKGRGAITAITSRPVIYIASYVRERSDTSPLVALRRSRDQHAAWIDSRALTVSSIRELRHRSSGLDESAWGNPTQP
ncbi:hypothetical protein EDB87DRAFT_1577419 [Lactarius vividus]|nr:hypothetical protein EDB87DRAFT_1577419 [Lactarius vividus]